MNALIILGNGFDLSHDLPTSYGDFIKHLVEEHIKDKSKFSDLFSLRVLGSYKDFLKNTLKNNIPFIEKTTQNSNNYYGAIHNKFLRDLIIDSSKGADNEGEEIYWFEIEELYYKKLEEIVNNYKAVKKIDREYNLVRLNKDFKQLKKHLEKYLSNIQGNSSKISSYQYFFDFIAKETKSSCVVNFNYTETYKKYYHSVNGTSKIIDIHGELGNEDNPIIFGYAPKEEDIRKLINLDQEEYLENIKTNHYDRRNDYNDIISFLKTNDNISVFIIGHSLGASDSQILNEIFNQKNVKKIILFSRDNIGSFNKKKNNIIRISDRELNLIKTKIVPFVNCPSIPQYDHKIDTRLQFNAFIESKNKEGRYFEKSTPRFRV